MLGIPTNPIEAVSFLFKADHFTPPSRLSYQTSSESYIAPELRKFPVAWKIKTRPANDEDLSIGDV